MEYLEFLKNFIIYIINTFDSINTSISEILKTPLYFDSSYPSTAKVKAINARL